MSENDKRRLRLALTRADRYVLILLAVMALATLAVNLLRAAGLRLVRGEIYLFLPGAMALMALGWLISLPYRRIARRPLRIAAGALLAVLALLAVTIGVSYISFLATLTVPQRYNAVVSPSGRSLVVLRLPDLERGAARGAEGDDAGLADAQANWGYVYTAYAPAAGIFYRPDSLIDGEVYIGHASSAQLMLEWEEDGAVGRFFVKDPEPGDGGEMRARAG